MYSVSGKDVAQVYGFWLYKSYADIRRGSLVSNASAVVENASFLFRSLYLPCKVPTACAWALPIEIYTASCGFLATARLLFY